MKKKGYWQNLKGIFAMLLVKFTFYLVVAILYAWLLVGLGFKSAFDWNLSLLIAISLLLFSMLFEGRKASAGQG